MYGWNEDQEEKATGQVARRDYLSKTEQFGQKSIGGRRGDFFLGVDVLDELESGRKSGQQRARGREIAVLTDEIRSLHFADQVFFDTANRAAAIHADSHGEFSGGFSGRERGVRGARVSLGAPFCFLRSAIWRSFPGSCSIKRPRSRSCIVRREVKSGGTSWFLVGDAANRQKAPAKAGLWPSNRPSQNQSLPTAG